ncbi:MAG: hypothetical protein AAF615_03905 [Pseudomonadota bacterium]
MSIVVSMLRTTFACCLLLLASDALAGAWTVKPGETKVFTASTFTYGNHGFDENGKLVAVPDYQKFTLNSAVEYGVRSWLTGLVKAELREERGYGELYRDRFPNPIFDPGQPTVRVYYGERSDSFGAVAGGARVRLLNGAHSVLSAEGLVASGGVDTNGAGAPSDGPFVEVRGLVGTGHTLAARPVFANVEAAYRYRFDADDADEVLVDVTLGAQVLPRWMLLAQSFSTYEVDGNSHYTKVGASVVYQVKPKLALELGGLATVYGKNAIQEFGGKLGFWWTY